MIVSIAFAAGAIVSFVAAIFNASINMQVAIGLILYAGVLIVKEIVQ